MEGITLVLSAVLPFVILFFLLIYLRWPAIKALPVVWFLTLLIAIFVWRIEWLYIPASFIKSIFMALEIILIILGAVWVLEIMKKSRHMRHIEDFLTSISPDSRVQALIIGWIFVSLMEGVAGFGTPAAIAAPLLVAIGFKPILAVVVALIANSIATTFGAAGTPVLLGLGSLGFERTLLEEVGIISAGLHLAASIVIPLAVVYIVSSEIKRKKGETVWDDVKPMVPFSIFAWLSFGIPYFLSALFIGPELPSIIASLFALLILSLSAKKKFLVPKKVVSFKRVRRKNVDKKRMLFSVTPYILIVLFLMMTRISGGLKDLLQSADISFNVLGTSASFSYQPFFTPAFYFFLSGLICIFLFKMKKDDVYVSIKDAVLRIKTATVALIFALGLVQLFMLSENNYSGLEGMPMILAEATGNLFKGLYPIVSPLIGAFGSFISGSNTVSNILFGVFQSESAIALGISVPLILALQSAGGAIGNMIAIHNVLAASATVGIHHQESTIIRKTIIVMFLYSLLLGILGMILAGIL